MRNDNLKPNDIFWNTLGTCSYAIVSLALSIIIIKLSGKIDGGIFSFGFSTLARVAFIITFFGIRPLHIVDIKYNYSFDTYSKLGRRLAIMAFLICTLYVSYRYYIGTYSLIKSILLILLVLHGTIDGFSDYYECEYQRANRLNMSGKSQFFRIMSFAIALIITLLISKDLLISEIIAVIVEICVFYYFNVRLSKNVFKKVNDNSSYQKLLIEALPLFLITFFDTIVFSMSKFFIDGSLGDVYSGFYNTVFMPTNAIYLLMTLFMKPVLTPLANAFYSDKKLYNKILGISLIVAIIISIVSILCAVILGNFYLDTIYYMTGNSYENLRYMANAILVVVIVGGSFYTLCTPMYYALIIENKRNYILIAYIITFVISIFITTYMVKRFEIMGAAYSFAISMFLVFVTICIGKLIASFVRR